MNDFKITKRTKFDFPPWLLSDYNFLFQFESLVNLYYSYVEKKENYNFLYAKLTNEVSHMVIENLDNRTSVITVEDYLKAIHSIAIMLKNSQIEKRKQEIEKDFD